MTIYATDNHQMGRWEPEQKGVGTEAGRSVVSPAPTTTELNTTESLRKGSWVIKYGGTALKWRSRQLWPLHSPFPSIAKAAEPGSVAAQDGPEDRLVSATHIP